jgi:hypothetical protein
MTACISVFVNASLINLPQGADVAAAVRMFDPMLESQVADGSAYVTDGRGIEISPGARLTGGAILRVVVRSRRGGNVDADA